MTDPQASAPASDDEEWEVRHDDGFIYERMKRPEETVAGESTNPADPEVERAEKERNRRKRKGKVLLKLKRKYQKEIDQWDILSNSLCALQEKPDKFPEIASSFETREQVERDSPSSLLLHQLLLMEEAREAMVKKVTMVCETAQEICRIEEEEKKEMFFNLPVWGSPKDLMASLCYDDDDILS